MSTLRTIKAGWWRCPEAPAARAARGDGGPGAPRRRHVASRNKSARDRDPVMAALVAVVGGVVFGYSKETCENSLCLQTILDLPFRDRAEDRKPQAASVCSRAGPRSSEG